MRAFLLAGLAAAFGGIVLATPTVAAPAQPLGVEQPAPGVEPAAMRRKRMMKRRSMRRSRMVRSRRTTPAAMGNAADPSRPAMQQRQGPGGGASR